MQKIFLIIFLVFIPTIIFADCDSDYNNCYEQCINDNDSCEDSDEICASVYEDCELNCTVAKESCEAEAVSAETETGETAAPTASTPTTAAPAEETTTTAATLDNPLKAQGDDPVAIIGNIIRAMLGVVGAVTLLMFLYGGFMLIFSAGEQEKLEKGRKTLIWAIIGLAIVLSSYSILSYVFKILVGSTT